MNGGFDLAGFRDRTLEGPLDQPVLAVVVDTEEEFDWDAPFSRDSTAVSSVPAQDRAQDIFARFGVVPTYVIDYAVANDPAAGAYFAGLRQNGAAEIGAHLHPWVTPPHEETVNIFNSFHGNLPAELESAKLRALTERIAEAVGARPTIFKAGRYGLGPHTYAAIQAEGYRIDCSVVPYTDFSPVEGPSFRGFPARPYWVDADRSLLEVPLTRGFFGPLAGLGPALQFVFDAPMALRCRLPGILGRLGLQRSTLTPEGVTAGEQIRLLRALYRQGMRVFTMTYHSPSLAPGHTPYVRTDEDLKEFLNRIETVLAYFRDGIGGRFVSLSGVYDALCASA